MDLTAATFVPMHWWGDPLHGDGYQLASGLGVQWLAAWYVWWRKHNCHARRCWRLGKHQVEGTPYIVCRIHHPTVPDNGAHPDRIREAHRERETERLRRPRRRL